MAKLLIPQPISVGLMLSYVCSAKCRHCMDVCSPDWTENWLAVEDIQTCMRQLYGQVVASPWGPHNVSMNYGLHFTGGEPFLNFELLVKAVELAEGYSIPSTYVETNCYWCRDDVSTAQKLQALKSKGLKGILVSINPFYLEFIPFEYTQRCVKIAKGIFGDMNVMIFQQEYFDQFKEMKIKNRMIFEDYLSKRASDPLWNNEELFLCGRATYKLRGQYALRPAYNLYHKACHPSLLKNWHNHFDNYGNLIPGHCAGITLGSWKELTKLTFEGIELDDFPVLQKILSNDFDGLLEYAKSFGYKTRPKGYISKCDLCLDLRTFLVSVKDYPELQPKEFYQQVKAEQ
jgi:hypothetical protein